MDRAFTWVPELKRSWEDILDYFVTNFTKSCSLFSNVMLPASQHWLGASVGPLCMHRGGAEEGGHPQERRHTQSRDSSVPRCMSLHTSFTGDEEEQLLSKGMASYFYGNSMDLENIQQPGWILVRQTTMILCRTLDGSKIVCNVSPPWCVPCVLMD